MWRRPNWLDRGDRSHPNLKKLDELKPKLNFRGWERCFQAAETAHIEGKNFELKLFQLVETQKVSDGDRSHHRLVCLDSLSLSYPGWWKDIQNAEAYHLTCGASACAEVRFSQKIEGMIRKQQMHEGDRSHQNLKKLNGLKLTYPGWEQDVSMIEMAHKEGDDGGFEAKLWSATEKQRVYKQGDRSHPRLIELDSLVLTYPGWQADVEATQEYHLTLGNGILSNTLFDRKVEGMRNKQRLYLGDRSHPHLEELDRLQLTYPTWEQDVWNTERAHCEGESIAWRLDILKQKQKVYLGDRSHWRLQALDAMHLSYPGHEEDIKKAEEYHLTRGDGLLTNVAFEKKLDGMKNKQQLFLGYQAKLRQWTIHRNRTFQQHAGKRKSKAKYDEENGRPNLGCCIVCMTEPKTHAVVPCGHLSLCSRCCSESMNRCRRCPICRQPADHVMRIYVA